MSKVPYVHSNYDRVPGDYYPTIDKRCVYGFLEHFHPRGLCVDVCAPEGSGIVDTLRECGVMAIGESDAYKKDLLPTDWIITNPPYDRALVDDIISFQIARLASDQINGLAVLLRSNFAYAKSRVGMFKDCPLYYGEIKLLFRPYWNDERKAQPIHNYVWHIWKRPEVSTFSKTPIQLYSLGNKPT